MTSRRSSRSALVLAAVLLASCGSAQKVSVRTDPDGAEVYLQRRGDLEINARVKGIPGKVTASAFEEDFRLLGNAPVEYEFELSEDEVGIDVPEGSGSVTRHYKEGTIRVERPGYETVVRLVRFSGSPVDLTIALQPVRDE
ncbi:MAG: hypothetical protein WBP17_15100 [Gemmatimonadota bacterium]